MAEIAEESEHVWSSKPRTAYFLSAMRHFREDYLRLGAHSFRSLSEAVADAVSRHRPGKLVLTETGDHRVEQALLGLSRSLGVPLDLREDTHFFISRREFAAWARRYKELRMEFFYRMIRKRHDVLMDEGEPLGGCWNYDAENRGSFGKGGP